MTRIVNLTLHPATPDQQRDGVVDIDFDKSLLTFDDMPTQGALQDRAKAVVHALDRMGNPLTVAVMIGGAPYFMPFLQQALLNDGLRVFYAFSTRESVEVTLSDGSVQKQSNFKHRGLIEIS